MKRQHRRSIRLEGWDYTRLGAYFVTVCTQNRRIVFGDIENNTMKLNQLGLIVEKKWKDIPKHFANVQLDAFQIMPNHIHGILFIVNDVGAKHSKIGLHKQNDNHTENASPLQTWPQGTQPGSLSAIMQNYLSITTRKINQIRKTPGNKLWQRNYYDRIVRNESELHKIREYIVNNPLKWELDRENPINRKGTVHDG